MKDDPTPERTDASFRTIGLTAGSLVLGIAAALVVGGAIYLHRPGMGRVASLGAAARFQHGSEQRTSVAEDWAKLDRTTHDRLAGYGWVDRRAGIVRIPIERAMERVAERGGAQR